MNPKDIFSQGLKQYFADSRRRLLVELIRTQVSVLKEEGYTLSDLLRALADYVGELAEAECKKERQ